MKPSILPLSLLSSALLLVPKAHAQNAAQETSALVPPFHLPDNVIMKTDIVYATTGTRELHLDLILPKAGQGLRPAIVYVRGGGWHDIPASRTQFHRQAAYMAGKGYVGTCIEYRTRVKRSTRRRSRIQKLRCVGCARMRRNITSFLIGLALPSATWPECWAPRSAILPMKGISATTSESRPGFWRWQLLIPLSTWLGSRRFTPQKSSPPST